MRYLIDLIWHFLSSNSRHGIHSPFVYALAEKAIYAKQDTESLADVSLVELKYRHVLSRVLNHLGVDKIQLPDGLVSVGQDGEKRALLIAVAQLQETDIGEVFDLFDVVVLDGIYRNATSKRIWEKLINRPEVTVSIDLFYFGLLFHRQGQAKEHFKLRFPWWLERTIN